MDEKEKNNKEHEQKKSEEPGEEKIRKLEQEKEEYLDGWKRAKADLINYKKEEAKRFESIVNYGLTELIRDFIPVLDSFDLALSALEKEGKAEKGVYMIKTQLEEVLKKRGLERIRVHPGDAFDINQHESLGEMASQFPVGTIAEEIEPGYQLNGRVVRPARVKISKIEAN